MKTSPKLLTGSLLIAALAGSAQAQVSSVSAPPSLPSHWAWALILNQYGSANPHCQDPFRFHVGADNQSNEAVANIKFHNAVDSITSYGLQSTGELLTDKGFLVAVDGRSSVDNFAGHVGSATGQLGLAGGYFAGGRVTGVSGSAYSENLPTFDSTMTSSASGGYFIGGAPGAGPAPVPDGSGTYWIGGSVSSLTGDLLNPLPQGAYAAVIGLDESVPSTSVPSFAGYFSGDVHATGDMTATTFTVSSSIRWKEDVATLEQPLELIEDLRGVRYTWSETGDEHIGFIAEEVAEVCPEIVTFEPDGTTPRGVEYARMAAILVEAVQEQQEQIDALRTELAELRAEHR